MLPSAIAMILAHAEATSKDEDGSKHGWRLEVVLENGEVIEGAVNLVDAEILAASQVLRLEYATLEKANDHVDLGVVTIDIKRIVRTSVVH